MKKTTWMALALMGLTAPATAQNVVTAGTPAGAAERQATTLAATAGVQSRITVGAPYSAETVTESVQLLANGTRIARKLTTRVCRDAEGRTRTERLSATGEVENVIISDPVQGTSYVLNPKTHVAYRTQVIVATSAGTAITSVSPGRSGTTASTQAAGDSVAAIARGRGGAGGGAVAGGAIARGRGSAATGGAAAGGVVTMRGGQAMVSPAAGDTTREDLGQQTIEGVLATGTRTTTIIPVGAIGNDQPIQVVSEQWFSPDLEVLVLTKHSDPRVGETTFRMTGIVRANPAMTLFEVPTDYKLEQSVIRRDLSR